MTLNAIGPETFTYKALVQTIGELIGCHRPILATPPLLGYIVGKIAGSLVDDVVVTRDEIEGLMADLLHVKHATHRPQPA